MRSPDIAARDTLSEMGMLQLAREIVTRDPERWLVTFESLPASPVQWRLDVEVLDGPVVCVLNRYNIGYMSMSRIMNKFTRRLDEPRASRPLGQSPPGGEPAPS